MLVIGGRMLILVSKRRSNNSRFRLDAASTKWTSDHKLLDTAYMVVKLTYDQEQFAQGLPNISTVVRGKKEFGIQKSFIATVVDAQNPALCVRDYLTDTKYGLGESSAKYCISLILQ